MKVGVDAVLLAAWADVRDRLSILDVGTGCGVIALAMAQRAETARIDAIEIDPPSFEEALENFSISPWADRLRGYMVSFDDFVRSSTDKYDLIISNPPFFDSGITTPSEGRETARHIGSLSPFSLLCLGKKLITENGIIALISPAGMERRLMECAEDSGLSLIRMIRIKGTVNATTPKRIMMEFGRKAYDFFAGGKILAAWQIMRERFAGGLVETLMRAHKLAGELRVLRNRSCRIHYSLHYITIL